ncbi:hypothetical protein [Peijinzhouia sedimentorum]
MNSYLGKQAGSDNYSCCRSFLIIESRIANPLYQEYDISNVEQLWWRWKTRKVFENLAGLFKKLDVFWALNFGRNFAILSQISLKEQLLFEALQRPQFWVACFGFELI